MNSFFCAKDFYASGQRKISLNNTLPFSWKERINPKISPCLAPFICLETYSLVSVVFQPAFLFCVSVVFVHFTKFNVVSFSKEETHFYLLTDAIPLYFARMDKVTWRNWLKILYFGSTLHQA